VPLAANIGGNPEWFGDDGTTDEGEEPPTSDIDTPAMSTVSSTASVDTDNDVQVGYQHRKRKLSISPSDKVKTSHKLPRTAYRQLRLKDKEYMQSKDEEHTQPKDEERTYQNDSSEHNASGIHTNPDTVAPSTRTSLGTATDHSEVGRKVQPGGSRSALASRKLRDEVTSGTYIVREKRFKNWKEKIFNLCQGHSAPNALCVSWLYPIASTCGIPHPGLSR
jgi:hypothetical protein